MKYPAILMVLLFAYAAEAQEYEQPSAAQLLEQGVSELAAGRYEPASVYFERALASDGLSDIGKTVAYWGLFDAERELGHVEQTAEAASYFAVSASEVLRFQPEQKSFIESFRLRHKLDLARAVLSAIWAQQMSEYGGSPSYPVRIHNREELSLFVKFVGLCEDGTDAARTVWQVESNWQIELLIIQCGQARREFHFTYR